MSGYNEGSDAAREDAMLDEPDTLAGGEFSEELERATHAADEDLGGGDALQPESQGEDPLVAEIGEQGQGDVGPADL